MTEKIQAGTVNIIQSKPAKKPTKQRSVSKPKPANVNVTVKQGQTKQVSKARATARRAGEMVAVKGKTAIGNIKANTNKNLAKTLAFGAAGAVLYPLIPTALQAITKKDWSGYKGLLTGVATASVIGLAIGRPEMAVGALSAMGTHLLYAKGTKAIEDTFGTQIYRMNPNNVVYQEDLQKLVQSNAGALSDNLEIVNDTETVNTSEIVDTSTVSESADIVDALVARCNESDCGANCVCRDALAIGHLVANENISGEIISDDIANDEIANNETVRGINLNDLSVRGGSFGRVRNFTQKYYTNY